MSERVPFRVFRDGEWVLIGYVDKEVSDYLEQVMRDQTRTAELLNELERTLLGHKPETYDEALAQVRARARRERWTRWQARPRSSTPSSRSSGLSS